MAREVDNSQDILDSRDIIARLEELEADLQNTYDERLDTEDGRTFEDWIESLIADNTDLSGDALEYKSLKALCDEAEGYAEDWKYGSTLIRESYFTEYAEELCRDIGDLPKELPSYIECHIDWEGVARDIKTDYTEVDFDGVTYYVR